MHFVLVLGNSFDSFPLQIFVKWEFLRSTFGSPKHQLASPCVSACFSHSSPLFLINISPVIFFPNIFHRPMLHVRWVFWFHPSPPERQMGQTPEVQLIDFGRSASKAALTGPCGEAFRAGHESRWLPLGGRQGFPPEKRWARFWEFLGIAVRNGVVIFFEWMGCDVSIYFANIYIYSIWI